MLQVGSSVDGLGGFILEAADGSVSYDMRFDTLLETAWVNHFLRLTKYCLSEVMMLAGTLHIMLLREQISEEKAV